MAKLRVFYGYTKLTKKAIREPELAIYFENSYSYKNEDWIKRRMIILYIRNQTKKEMMDCGPGKTNRMFDKYGYKIDLKPFKGDIEKVLEYNYLADKNNISKKERDNIRDILRKNYYSFYQIERKPVGQQSLIFN